MELLCGCAREVRKSWAPVPGLCCLCAVRRIRANNQTVRGAPQDRKPPATTRGIQAVCTNMRTCEQLASKQCPCRRTDGSPGVSSCMAFGVAVRNA